MIIRLVVQGLCHSNENFYMWIFFFSGLPVQVRDTAVGAKDEVPKSIVNREYYIQNTEKMVRAELSCVPQTNKTEISETERSTV